MLLADERLVPMVSQLIPLDWVATDTPAGMLLAALLNEAVHGEFDTIRGALGRLDAACQATAAALNAEPLGAEVDESDKLRSINGVLRSFHARHIQARLRAIDARIAGLPATEIEALNLLLREKIELRKLLNQPPQL